MIYLAYLHLQSPHLVSSCLVGLPEGIVDVCYFDYIAWQIFPLTFVISSSIL